MIFPSCWTIDRTGDPRPDIIRGSVKSCPRGLSESPLVGQSIVQGIARPDVICGGMKSCPRGLSDLPLLLPSRSYSDPLFFLGSVS